MWIYGKILKSRGYIFQSLLAFLTWSEFSLRLIKLTSHNSNIGLYWLHNYCTEIYWLVRKLTIFILLTRRFYCILGDCDCKLYKFCTPFKQSELPNYQFSWLVRIIYVDVFCDSSVLWIYLRFVINHNYISCIFYWLVEFYRKE